MSVNSIAIVILTALLVEWVVQTVSDVLNIRQMQKGIPAGFEGHFDDARYRRSVAYATVNTRLKWVAGGFHLSVFLLFWFLGGFSWLDQMVRSVFEQVVPRGLLYIGMLGFAHYILSIPFSVYSTFVIESKFGFNKTTLKIFLSDMLKQGILAILLGGILLSVILVFFEYGGAYAWLYGWIAFSGFVLVMQMIVPAWIMPLFNKFRPLEPGPLRDAIVGYAGKIDFPVKNIYVMDGSKRSGKSNAFFSGFGKQRKIVLFDTLIEKHTIDELVAVLAHEMGHYKQKHIFRMLAIGILQVGILFYLLSLFLRSPLLAGAFFVEQASVYTGLVFFAILYSPIDMLTGLFFQWLSRKHEFAADRFAASTTNDPEAMKNALKKLASHNLSNLNPHWLHVWLNYSHPPVSERVAAIEREAGPG
jgi:STE24 endopeptidase